MKSLPGSGSKEPECVHDTDLDRLSDPRVLMSQRWECPSRYDSMVAVIGEAVGLNAMQIKFCIAYVTHGDPHRAYKEAGYTGKSSGYDPDSPDGKGAGVHPAAADPRLPHDGPAAG